MLSFRQTSSEDPQPWSTEPPSSWLRTLLPTPEFILASVLVILMTLAIVAERWNN